MKSGIFTMSLKVSLLPSITQEEGGEKENEGEKNIKIQRERRRGKEKERGRKMGEEREKLFQRVVQNTSIIDVFLLEIPTSVAYA